MTTSASDFVTLRSGPTLPLAVVRLALDLEARGLTLKAECGELIVHPGGQLSDQDRRDIRQWKSHLLALLAYEPPPPQ